MIENTKKKNNIKSIICFILVICTMVSLLSSCKKEKIVADVIVYGNNIYTSDDNNKFVSAFAVKDGKYIAVGSKDEVDIYKGDSTKIYNASFVMPGVSTIEWE